MCVYVGAMESRSWQTLNCTPLHTHARTHTSKQTLIWSFNNSGVHHFWHIGWPLSSRDHYVLAVQMQVFILVWALYRMGGLLSPRGWLLYAMVLCSRSGLYSLESNKNMFKLFWECPGAGEGRLMLSLGITALANKVCLYDRWVRLLPHFIVAMWY